LWFDQGRLPPKFDAVELTAEQLGWLDSVGPAAEAPSRLLYDDRHPCWRGLARALIPDELASILICSPHPQSLVVSPSAYLAALPVSALDLGEGPLLRHALITHRTSLSWATPTRPLEVTGGSKPLALAYFGEVPGAEEERAALCGAFDIVEVADAEALLRELNGLPRLLVIAAHGDGEPGLRHGLQIGDQVLQAVDLLASSLPRTVVLGACRSGQLAIAPGWEPLGLATVCLLAGADAVVGAVFDVPGIETGQVLGSFYRQLALGDPADVALRSAQIEFLAMNESAPPLEWAGFAVFGANAVLPSSQE
jgi:hypothetical protein